MLLDEGRRDEVAGRAAVHEDYRAVMADETSKLDELASGGKLVDLHGRGAGWRRGERLLFMSKARGLRAVDGHG